MLFYLEQKNLHFNVPMFVLIFYFIAIHQTFSFTNYNNTNQERIHCRGCDATTFYDFTTNYCSKPLITSDDAYILKTNCLPNDTRFYPTIANGFLGHKIFSDTVYMNGLYNGRKGESHRAKLPVSLPLIYSSSLESSQVMFIQNMRNATFSIQLVSDSLKVRLNLYAHRLYTRLLVLDLNIEILQPGIYNISLKDQNIKSSDDIIFKPPSKVHYSPTRCNSSECLYLFTATSMSGQTKISEDTFSHRQHVNVIYSNIPSHITFNTSHSHRLPLTKKFVFIVSIATTFEEADYFYLKGLASVAAGGLYDSHVSQWKKAWSIGNIDINGDLAMNQAIKSSLYYLLSSMPPLDMARQFPFEFYGLSPGGLPHGGAGHPYFGHVFWDQEFWMLPGLLPFYPELVKLVIKYRAANILGACEKANSLGFLGAAYPWESAYTGNDVCPGLDYITREIHITGDIIHLLKQYIYITEDWDIFSEKFPIHQCRKRSFLKNYVYKIPLKGMRFKNSLRNHKTQYSCKGGSMLQLSKCALVTVWDMLRETAKFWQSRVKWNKNVEKYVIDGVMGPDEWHSPVNNSAFTNVIAMQNLNFAADVAEKLKTCPKMSSKWRYIAQRMYVPFDQKNHYHPEYDGFKPHKDIVKQADTILLGFPLMLNMTEEVRSKDLFIYQKVTTSEGPAMTWSMFAINWLSLKRMSKASSAFLHQVENIHPPFNIWSENADGSGAVNFLTGMGGFIQSIVYGYFGLRISNKALIVDPVVLPSINGASNVSDMNMNTIFYQGAYLKLNVTHRILTITIVDLPKRNSYNYQHICVAIKVTATKHTRVLCDVGNSFVIKRTKCEISVISAKDPR